MGQIGLQQRDDFLMAGHHAKGRACPGQVIYWSAFLATTQLPPSGATAVDNITRILHYYR